MKINLIRKEEQEQLDRLRLIKLDIIDIYAQRMIKDYGWSQEYLYKIRNVLNVGF